MPPTTKMYSHRPRNIRCKSDDKKYRLLKMLGEMLGDILEDGRRQILEDNMRDVRRDI